MIKPRKISAGELDPCRRVQLLHKWHGYSAQTPQIHRFAGIRMYSLSPAKRYFAASEPNSRAFQRMVVREAVAPSPQRIRRRRGYGLLEMLICLSLVSLLFLGAMTLIMTATRSVVRTQAQVYATGDAANSIQNIIGQLREASGFALPTSSTAGAAENNWTAMGNTSLTQFSTTLNGETINTAIQVIAPQAMTPQTNGYPTLPAGSGLRVMSTTGSYWESGPTHANWPTSPYNVQVPGGGGLSTVSLIYRGDPNGTPDAAAGTYLWEYPLPSNSSFNPAVYPETALCKSVGTAANAVQFVRPAYGGVAEQTQLEIKIISSYYSPVNSQQTSEAGSGATSSLLTGKCVYMRDHCTNASDNVANPGVQPSNNVFQAH